MGKNTRVIISVVIFVAIVGFGIFAFIGQDSLIELVDDFFSSIGSGLSDNAIRNITFELFDSEYPNTTFTFDYPVNITVDSSNFTINTITTLEARTPTLITGFTGTVNIIDTGEVVVTGNYESIEISGLKISASGTIEESTAKFNNVFLQNVKMKSFAISESYALLDIDGIEMDLDNQTVEIYAPIADFTYDDNVNIVGKANRMKITGENVLSITN